MTDREAMLALVASEPEPFFQVRPGPDDHARWQTWHDRYIEAVAHTRAVASDG